MIEIINMIIKNTNYKELSEKILLIFKQLLGKDFEKIFCQNGFKKILETYKILEKVKRKNSLSRTNFSKEEIRIFLKRMLDSAGISYASGTKKDLEIFNIELLGRKNNIANDLKDAQIENFLFSKLFQGWWNSNQNTEKIKDLNFYKKFKKRKCDYEIKLDEYNSVLVECKRVHSNKNLSLSDFIEALVIKINEKLFEAENQFKDTQNILMKEKRNILYRHFLIDISAYYVREFKSLGNNFSLDGFDEKDIDNIKKRLLVKIRSYIGKITDMVTDVISLCYSQIIYKDEIPIAIIHATNPLFLTIVPEKFINYSGWMIVGYPRSENLSNIVDIRVSSCARKLAWIKAEYLSNTDSLLSFGEEERDN